MPARAPAPGQLISGVAQTIAEMAARCKAGDSTPIDTLQLREEGDQQGQENSQPFRSGGRCVLEAFQPSTTASAEWVKRAHFTIGKTETQGSCAFAQGY